MIAASAPDAGRVAADVVVAVAVMVVAKALVPALPQALLVKATSTTARVVQVVTRRVTATTLAARRLR